MDVSELNGPATVPPALNSEFARFLTRPNSNHVLPLAIRRFMAEVGCSDPEGAMRLATERTLASYAGTQSLGGTFSSSQSQQLGCPEAKAAHVSVERLCATINVDLIGAPRRQERSVNRNDYEATPYSHHSASVEFACPRPIIRLPLHIGWNRGRVAAAHEIGHVLIHRREDAYDEATVRLGSTLEEEILAEYGARLLLLPKELHERWLEESGDDNYALKAVKMAQRAQVSLHTAVARLGDPDVGNRTIRGAIFWRTANGPANDEAADLLTPCWHLCPGAYVPVGRCKARRGSLIGELASEADRAAGNRVEEVNVGTLRGRFLVDAFAWGSLTDRTRVVLSVFRTDIGS
jgi:hypothetical protein